MGRSQVYSRLPASLASVVALLQDVQCPIQEGMKRTVRVNVKMTEEDFRILKRAAEKRRPDAVMTNSGIVLALAEIAARETHQKRRSNR